MTVKTIAITLNTRGDAHIIEITNEARQAIERSELSAGILTLFVPGSTAGLTTIEYESGAISDFQRLFDEIAAPDRHYAHNARWGDGNGHSHVRAALLGPSITIPFSEGRLMLGTWQQIILVDFDNRPRSRSIVAQVMGE